MENNRKLNNKGYMLIEIILASAIAFGLAYFMLELTLKLKNKNDDLLVETLTVTDNAIISNAIMRYFNESETVDCRDIRVYDKKVYVDDKFVTEINDYVTIGQCNDGDSSSDRGHINIPLTIKQLNNKRYDVDIYFKYN